MKIITLYRPWAYWIIWGWKIIETRDHDKFKFLEGQTIGIHAGKKWDFEALRIASPFLTESQYNKTLGMYRWNKLHGGLIIGTAYVEKHRKLSPADSKDSLFYIAGEANKYGLILSNVVEFREFIQAEGHQGVWRYPINMENK